MNLSVKYCNNLLSCKQLIKVLIDGLSLIDKVQITDKGTNKDTRSDKS